MTSSPTIHLDAAGGRPRRALRRAAHGRRVASWTGRSVVSSATDSALSRIATAGARKTRVSDLRDAAAATAAVTAAISQRRRPSGPAAVITTFVSG